jgi:hypothetical protein
MQHTIGETVNSLAKLVVQGMECLLILRQYAAHDVLIVECWLHILHSKAEFSRILQIL